MLLLRPPGVYQASDDTTLLAEVLHRGGYARGRRVLDLGCGSGALAVDAARAGARSVTAVDLSWRSVFATWCNTRAHGTAVRVRRGDLFAPVRGERYDLVLTNPPYVPARSALPPRHRVGRCWDAGLDGRLLLDRICDGAAHALAEGGTVLFVHSTVSDEDRTLARLRAAGLWAEVIARRRLAFGPVMRARAELLEDRGLLADGCREEEVVVVEARRA